MNVIVRTDEGAVSLIVDDIGDVLDLDPQNIERPPDNLAAEADGVVQSGLQAERFTLVVIGRRQDSRSGSFCPLERLELRPRGFHSREEIDMAQALVVDDSKATRMILTRALKEFGYVVTEAGDGQEALRELAQLKEVPDLILTDWNMPVMNGLEFLREVRKAERFASSAVVIGDDPYGNGPDCGSARSGCK